MIKTSPVEQARNRSALRQAEAQLEAVIRAANDGGRRGTRDVAREGVRRIKMILSVPYPPASQPGEPPHWRTEKLRKGYKLVPLPEAGWYTRVPYALYLEFGTRKMRPRPHVRPVVRSLIPDAPRIVAAAIERAERAEARIQGGRG